MKLIFAGTPEFAATALRALIDAGHDIVLVLTQPDRPAGRGMKLLASPVKQLALEYGLPVYQPERLRTEEQQEPLRALKADAMVVAAYGIILPQAVLDLPRYGCINIHASLLPRWRGAAPIHRAIEAGDAETGITIMQMDAGLDTGDMLSVVREPITAHTTTALLHDQLAQAGGAAIVAALADLPRLQAARQPQPAAGVTYADKIRKDEAALDWSRPAVELARKIRAFDPFPGTTFRLGDAVFKCWAAEPLAGQGVAGTVLASPPHTLYVACGEGVLSLTELQRPGGKRLPVREFLAGGGIAAGTQLA